LHCCIYCTLNISLLFGAGFRSTNNTETGSSVLYCLIFQMFVTVCLKFLSFDFDTVEVDAILQLCSSFSL
jgi:hypothetical protein